MQLLSGPVLGVFYTFLQAHLGGNIFHVRLHLGQYSVLPGYKSYQSYEALDLRMELLQNQTHTSPQRLPWNCHGELLCTASWNIPVVVIVNPGMLVC
jgi:hypothetical protein